MRALRRMFAEIQEKARGETPITGVWGIRDELEALGYSTSYRTVRRMLERGEIPATRKGKSWRTTRSMLEGQIDTVRRAAGQQVCLCRLCPQHAHGAKKMR